MTVVWNTYICLKHNSDVLPQDNTTGFQGFAHCLFQRECKVFQTLDNTSQSTQVSQLRLDLSTSHKRLCASPPVNLQMETDPGSGNVVFKVSDNAQNS
jgi:hypothetical protein